MAMLSYDELNRQLASHQFTPAPVIAVTGGEDFLRAEAYSAVRRELEAKGYGYERFDDEEKPAIQLVHALRTVSMFGDKTAIGLRSVRRGNKAETAVRFKEELLEYLDNPGKANILLIDGATWNGSHAVPRKVKQNFLTIECPEFKPWQGAEIERFIETRAKLRGLKLAAHVAAELRDVCGDNLGLVDSELEKLSLVVKARALTIEDVRANLNYRGGDESFALCDAIIDGNRAKALDLCAKVMRDAEQGTALQFLGLLESQYRKLAKLSALIRTDASPTTVLARAGFNPRSPRNEALLRAARNLSPKDLRRGYSALLDVDLEMKSGQPDAPALITALVYKLTHSSVTPQRNNEPKALALR